jgi:hypothetical protein
MVVALMLPEMGLRPIYGRAVYSLTVATAFFGPAVSLYFFPTTWEAKTSYWQLLWTFAFLAYLVHFLYGTSIMFDSNIRWFYPEQSGAMATLKAALVLWWALDVLLIWFSRSTAGWVTAQRTALHLVATFGFFIFTYTAPQTSLNYLGATMTALVVVFLLVRVGQKRE